MAVINETFSLRPMSIGIISCLYDFSIHASPITQLCCLVHMPPTRARPMVTPFWRGDIDGVLNSSDDMIGPNDCKKICIPLETDIFCILILNIKKLRCVKLVKQI